MHFEKLEPVAWTTFVDSIRARACHGAELRSRDEAGRRFARGNFWVNLLACACCTMAYSELPYAERAFVDELTTKADERVTNGTPALVLLATNGREPSWNDCRQSQAHLALPLLSTAFVDGVPMLARLPKELGFDLRWIDAAPEVHTRRQALAGRSRRQTTGFNSATRSQALSSVDAPNSR